MRLSSFFPLWLALLALPAMVAVRAETPPPPAIEASAYILVDQHSGQVLAEREADARVEPASLTKLMTSLVAFDALAEGRLKLDDTATISDNAFRAPGARMYVEAGAEVRVEDLLQGMIVQSANDATVALAERIAGSEEAFAALMNEKAGRLGLTNTRFANSTGMPAPDQYSSARDIARIARALIAEHPEHYHWYKEREFTYNGITQHNRNALLWQDPTVDGLKTGHTEGARYCLAASAERGGMRLVSVVMGAPNDSERAAGSRALLDYGFEHFETHRLFAAGEEVTRTKVWKGEEDEVPLGLDEDLYLTIPRGRYKDLTPQAEVPPQVLAPLAQHADVGEVRIALGDDVLAERPLRTLAPVDTGGLLKRVADQIALWFD